MKIKDGFLLREIAGNAVIVPVGENTIDFKGIISINDTGRFIWNLLENGVDKQELLAAFLAEFEVSEEEAKQDIADFLQVLLDNGVMEL